MFSPDACAIQSKEWNRFTLLLSNEYYLQMQAMDCMEQASANQKSQSAELASLPVQCLILKAEESNNKIALCTECYILGGQFQITATN